METDTLMDITRRIDNLESQVRAISDHLKIVLLYSPQKYEVVSKEKLEKEMTAAVIK
jgi:hypothetical protein